MSAPVAIGSGRPAADLAAPSSAGPSSAAPSSAAPTAGPIATTPIAPTPAAPTPAAPTPASKIGLTIGLGSASVFFIALELTIIAVAMPAIAADHASASRATLSWIFTAYNVGVAAFLLIGGWLAERFGRRRLFLIGLALFTAGSLASGLAPGIGALIAARTLQAGGGALLIPASLALILHAVPQERHNGAIGVWGAMAGLAAAVGPTLGAVLVDAVGWRSVFLVNVPLAVAVGVVGHRHLTESRDPLIGSGVDLVAVPAGALSVGLAIFIIVAAETIGWTSPITMGCGFVAAALLAFFVRRSRHHPKPVFDPAIATTPSFVVGSLGTLLFVGGFTGWLVFSPTFLTDVWGYSILRAGIAIAPGALAMAVTAGPAGRIAGRFGHRPVIVTGALLATAAAAWFIIFVGAEPDYVADLLPGLVLLGVGVGAGFPMLAAVAMSEVEPRRYAMGAAGSTTVRQLAMAVGIAVATALLGRPDQAPSAVGPYSASWAVCGALFASTALVMIISTRFRGGTSHVRQTD